MSKAQQPSNGTVFQLNPSVLNMLHDNIGFEIDENDFVDDADALDDGDDDLFPPPKRTCPPQVANTNTLRVPPTPAATAAIRPSSVPLPWSSSPPHHHQLPPSRFMAVQSAVDTKAEPDATAPLPEEKTCKRRALPWMQEKDNENEPAGAESKDTKKPRRKGAAVDGKPVKTPARDTKKAPWNMSGSALKSEQQKLRQKANQGKKMKDSNEGDGLPLAKAKKNRKGGKPIVLSEEQSKVLYLVTERGKSVFFTGSAGTGKSVLMREIIRHLRDKYSKEHDRVAVTASTGLAACNIGGVTLHSFGGIGLGKEPAEQLVKKIKRNMKAKNRWLRTKVLIIDEISMVDGDLFDKLEAVARAIRNNARPFGGIQLVVTGDFFQLPPVPDNGRVVKFAFDAGTWGTSIEHTIGLTQIFRQRDPGKMIVYSCM